MPVPDLERALALVNAQEYGTRRAVFTRDGATARSYASHVRAWLVGVNFDTRVKTVTCRPLWAPSVVEPIRPLRRLELPMSVTPACAILARCESSL